jgi:hypothetical protein
MELPILERQTLSILKRLEYQSNITRLSDPEASEVHIHAHDLDLSSLDKVEDLEGVALYLQGEGLDFYVTFDLRNDVPHELHFQGSDEWEEIAVVKGKSIKDIEEKIKEIELKLISKKELGNSSKNKTIQKLWIEKDEDGSFLFDRSPVYIKNKESDYAVIFDVVYSLSPEGGKIEYKKIIEQCRKRGKKINKKSILRVLTGKDANLFKYVKEFKQEPMYDKSLFVAMQNGNEIEFNNKK